MASPLILALFAGIAAVRADQACIDTCKSTAASGLGCNGSDLADCFCLADFATQAKACLYESGCSSDVSTFYNDYDSSCASVSVSASASATTSSASSATVDCLATCETSAASSLECDQSETSCFCTDDFASAVKSCLYSTDGCGGSYKASFHEEYDSFCASSSTSAGVSSNPTTASSAAVSSAAVAPSSTLAGSGYDAPYGSSNATVSATGSAGATSSVEAFTGAGVSMKQTSFAGVVLAALSGVVLL